MKRQKRRKKYARPCGQPRVAEPTAPAETYKSRATEPQRSKKAGADSLPARGRVKRLSLAERNRKAAALLRKWMADESGYDEEIWATLERELKDSAVRFRENFE
jgi:hypothetical protein